MAAAALLVVSALGGCAYHDRTQVNRLPSLHVAEVALASGAPDMALRVTDLILAQQPANSGALAARGDALYALGQRGRALEAYRAALAQDPTTVAAQIGLGRMLAASDPPGAEAAFLAALRQEPDNVVALNNLGVVRDLQGHNEAAQEAYRHALTVSPGSADVQINLGLSLARSGNAPDAVQVLRNAAEMPGVTSEYGRELLAALNAAGDQTWARQAMVNGSPEPTPRVRAPSTVAWQAAAAAAVAARPAAREATDPDWESPPVAQPTVPAGAASGATRASRLAAGATATTAPPVLASPAQVAQPSGPALEPASTPAAGGSADAAFRSAEQSSPGTEADVVALAATPWPAPGDAVLPQPRQTARVPHTAELPKRRYSAMPQRSALPAQGAEPAAATVPRALPLSLYESGNDPIVSWLSLTQLNASCAVPGKQR